MKLLTILAIALLIGGALAAEPKINPGRDINWSKNINSQINGVTAGTSSLDAANMAQAWEKANKTDAVLKADIGTYISGTSGYLPKFTGTNMLAGNSPLYTDGTNVGINTTTLEPTFTLVTGAANGTASGDYVTYSQMRETGSGYVFLGNTGAELHAFVDAHGPGIYYLPKTVVCNSQFVYDQPRVMFVGSSGPTNWLDAGATTYSGTFDFAGMADSTICMKITASSPYFLGCQFESDGANQVLVEVSYSETYGSHPSFIDCGFSQKYGSSGTCLRLYTYADNYQVIRCTFAVGAGGKGIEINGAGGGIINQGMIGGGGTGSIGLHVIKGAPRLTDVYLMDQAISIYLDPQNDYDVGTLLLTSVIADYADGGAGCGALICNGVHKTYAIWATNVDLWAFNGYGMYLSNIDQVYWVGGTIGGTGYEAIYVAANCYKLYFTGVQIGTGSANKHAVNFANVASIKNIRFMNCDITAPTAGYGVNVPDNVNYIDIAHNSVDTIVMTPGTYKTSVGNMPHG
ncbi:hypothetical protein M0R72_15815 [Candidatus Pacearchaeota archaeon]|jgi:hypothetical protein|nr:hypothetical protein [Candidatus Pacearchaeota archaeon]